MFWNSQIKKQKNKQRDLSSHWCGVLASRELGSLAPVSSCTQRFHEPEAQMPSEETQISLGNNFGFQGGPLVVDLRLPL